ncbi:A/G-specific adenine glycosylase [Altererythrobacter sp.]|uniref:A/G-specific adenine glycosylase n=1 Tax=Altererythrobacter sp. TaxID=1872480 RepID=UPI001B010166|nr:A/G-specific adenine glycosylase [Altererythrobacter sp.]MBO6608670.1 A/G-specific adenine glycosylase [Altererythrobacter sp.]MBO6642924.1 A/G-specific adenine glycosylase [Altererythrobacter sp.]MBO6709667.1 A/G-specific adenine glycosylase [Altererythrobacter sp.]
MTASAKTISDALLHWYQRHARELPWRNPPGKVPPNDSAWPYRVWLSEVMLQQTTVAAVKPYFAEFIETWPTVEALAAADDADVMSAWAGLGYYSRARNLVKCAREVARRGGFPETETELRELPGLGPYTAAAIAAIAFGQRAVVVDANVERVVARLFKIEEPLPGARKAIRERAEEVTPVQSSGDFAQAMMDLGSSICTSRDPKCLLCPAADMCQAKASGDPAKLPIKAPKKAKPERKGRAFWIERDDMVWLVTRPGTGMLGGMRALPDDGWSAQADGSGEAPGEGEIRNLGAVRHVFTHASLTLEVVRLNAQPIGHGEWWPLQEIENAGLPTLFAKAARLALAQR